MSVCPKCGFSLEPDDVECPACGIVVAKFRADAPPPAAPPPANPYAPPAAAVDTGGAPVPVAGSGVTPRALEALVGMRSWLRFVVGYSIAMIVLMLVAAVGVLFAGSSMAPLSLVYLLYAGVGLAIVLPLRRASQGLASFADERSDNGLETFLVEQAVFWRRAGVLTAVAVGLIAIGLVIGIIAGITS